MDKSLVTIGIPFYNPGNLLLDAVRSIFAQTYSNWELILIDDGSSDSSLEVARAIRDPRVRVYCDGANRGLPTRLNQIAQIAQTPYLARMDSDDMMHPERLSRQYHYLVENPHVDIVDTAIYSIDEHGQLSSVRDQKQLDVRPQSVLRKGLLFHPTILGWTDWFCKNPYNPQFTRAEDHELWCRTVAHTTFSRIAEPLLFYREGRGNLNNYLASQYTNRKILRQYGPAIVGEWRTQSLIFKSFAKGWTHRLCSLAGISRQLISLRNSRIKPVERENAMKILQRIKRTPIPGLNV